MPVPDLFRDGLARGWKTHNGAALDHDLTLEADVAIIGSGAGGGLMPWLERKLAAERGA